MVIPELFPGSVGIAVIVVFVVLQEGEEVLTDPQEIALFIQATAICHLNRIFPRWIGRVFQVLHLHLDIALVVC